MLKTAATELQGTRSKDWRWLAAVDLLESGIPASRRNDDTIIAAYRFLRIRRGEGRTRSPQVVKADEARAASNYPEIATAYQVYSSPGMYRWAIEALILADEPSVKIAGHTGFCLNTILAYERLFFDLRSRLSAFVCIHHECFKYRTCVDLDCRDPDVGWKYIGYYLGSKTLYNLFSIAPGDPAAERHFDSITKMLTRKLAMVNSFNRIITAESQASVAQEWLTIRRDDSKTPPSDKYLEDVATQTRQLNYALDLSMLPTKTGNQIAIEEHVSDIVKRLQSNVTVREERVQKESD